MHHRFLLRHLLCVFFAAMSLRAQAPGTAAAPAVMPEGLVLVAKTTGETWMTRVDGTREALKIDMRIPQSAKVNTGVGASVVLVFSNGATTQLGSDTELVIEQFLQDPFEKTIKVAEIEAEPSVSHTKLALNRGELVGNVKKLTKGVRESTFTVKTPVGAAGIRGTIFRIVFRPTGNGQAYNFQLTTAEGDVRFGQGADAGTPGATANVTGSGTTTVPVLGGQEIIFLDVEVTQNAQGQTVVTVLPPPPGQASPAPTSTMTAVTEVAVAVATAAAQTTFTSPPPSPPAGGGTTPGTGGGTPPANNDPGTSGSTTGSTSGSTTGGATTTSTTTGTTSTTSPTGTTTTTTQTSVTGQTSTGQGITAQLTTTTTTPPPSSPPRITSNPGP